MKICTFILILVGSLNFISFEVKSQDLDFLFFTYAKNKRSYKALTVKKGIGLQQSVKNKYGLNSFYKEIGMSKVPYKITNEGKLEAYANCNSIMNMGLCISPSKYDSLVVSAGIKMVNPTSIVIADSIKSNQDGFLFVNISMLLEQIYKDSLDSEEICCPEDNRGDREKKINEMFYDKLCLGLQLPEGIRISLFKGNDIRSEVTFKTFGSAYSTLDEEKGVIKIEPRQYVTIYERGKRGQSNEVWYLQSKKDNLTNRKYPNSTIDLEKFFGYQKYEVIDKNAILEIKFDQEVLANNIDFYGNISLQANVGERKIEVAPYYVIGEEQKAYGVNSKPIKEIADYFLSFMIEATKARSLYLNIEDSFQDIMSDTRPLDKNTRTELLNRIRNLRLYVNARIPGDSILFNDLDYQIREDIKEIGIESILRNVESNSLYLFYWYPVKLAKADFDSELDELEKRVSSSSFRKFKGKLKPEKIEGSNGYWQNFLNSTRRCLNYMDHISNSGSNSLEAFLGFTLINELDFQSVKNSITTSLEYLETYQRFDDIVGANGKHAEIDFHLQKLLIDLNNLRAEGSVINRLLQDRNLGSDFIHKDTIRKYNNCKNTSEAEDKALKWDDVKNHILKYSEWLIPKEDAKNFIDYYYTLRTGQESIIISEVQKVMGIKLYGDEGLGDSTYGPKTKQAIDKALNDKVTLDADDFTDGRKLMLYHYLEVGQRSLDSVINMELCYEKKIWEFLEEGDGTVLEYEVYNGIKSELAKLAGASLYNKLVFATIDLQKSNVEDGEYLEIAVMWYNINGSDDSPNEGIKLGTAKFLVKKTGWHVEPSEAVFFIKRFNEDLLRSNYPLSTSQFKATGSGSLLWTYHNKHRGRLPFLRWLEPSVGLNVAFLDFDTTKDFELGFGITSGFFRNALFFNGGYNLSVNGESPWYGGIGFSFVNGYQLAKNNLKFKKP